MKKFIRLIICMILLGTLLFPEPAAAAAATGRTLTEIYRLNARYQNAEPGGIALAGSSTLAKWTTAAADISSFGTFKEETVYNFGISAAKFQSLLDQRYINGIASKKPRVVIVYGANSLTVSRKKTSRNRLVVNQATNATIKFIEKLRSAIRRYGGSGTKFYYVSTVKTPDHYRTCKSKTVSCNIWDRIDLYNKRMRKYAASVSYCDYINIEPYYYSSTTTRNGKKKLRYYLDEGDLRDIAHTASAKALIRKTSVSPLFAPDLNHPSEQAYQLIWKNIAKQASVL